MRRMDIATRSDKGSSRKRALCGGVLSIRASLYLDRDMDEIVVVRE